MLVMALLLLLLLLLSSGIPWRLVRVLAFKGGDLVLELQDLILVVLVSLLDVLLVLMHALLQLALVLQILFGGFLFFDQLSGACLVPWGS
mmetsp:Transcript_31317/g.38766  ORF Transcript_31317/g.38766 Transcript_31317/m.38766 type:complete len:90 (+) Transcript_31317:3082-3351(+)